MCIRSTPSASTATPATACVVTVAVAAEHAEGTPPAAAVRRVMTEIPAEAVFLFLFRARPDRIIAANVNQRVAIARSASGTHVATAAAALSSTVSSTGCSQARPSRGPWRRRKVAEGR